MLNPDKSYIELYKEIIDMTDIEVYEFIKNNLKMEHMFMLERLYYYEKKNLTNILYPSEKINAKKKIIKQRGSFIEEE